MLETSCANQECAPSCARAVDQAQLVEPATGDFVQPARSKPPPDSAPSNVSVQLVVSTAEGGSSALVEDRFGSSFAGQFESYLGLASEDDFRTALRFDKKSYPATLGSGIALMKLSYPGG